MPGMELCVCVGVMFQVFYWHITHRDRVELLIEHNDCSSAEVLVGDVGILISFPFFFFLSATAPLAAGEPNTKHLRDANV